MTTEISPGRLAQVACLLEASARKPGNVHPHRGFGDCHYLDFASSALAIGPGLDLARTEGVGVAVLEAIAATRRLVSTNTNLGMVLLLAPLAAVRAEEDLQQGLGVVLEMSTVEDAARVYQAIRLANPGSLGEVDREDVAGDPTLRLLEVMRLAADRDLVARQYALGFEDVFEVALPAIAHSLAAGRPLETAIVAAHLALLSRMPDTLIVRKCGWAEAIAASLRAAAVLKAGWPDCAEAVGRFRAFDRWLRGRGHDRNPGATADLIAAALFAALRDGTIRLPLECGPAGWISHAV
jgi:triphosphoribosyl-dephospho-CoA synthase